VRRAVLLLLALLASAQAALAQARDTLLVFAASDLALALPEIARGYTARSGIAVNLVLGSTGNLALQVRHGAPADLLFAANIDYVDQLVAEGLAIAGTRTRYARGRIVLAEPRGRALGLTGLEGLLRPEVRRVAIANPDHAPYGKAAREALEQSGLWERLAPKLVLGENIRQTLQYVQTGGVDAAIVALAVADVPEIRWTLIDDELHRPIDQAAVVMTRSRMARAAAEFISYVTGSGWPVMARNGFLRPPLARR
jgi:molybdate transport system substrate-binding protein